MTIDTLSFQRTTDTLSLFQQGQLGGSSQSTIKADSDSLQLAQIHSAQEVISGVVPFFHSFGTRKEISFPASKRLCAAS